MTDRQNAFISMLKNVILFFTNRAAELAAIPAIEEEKAELQNDVTQLETAGVRQDEITAGVTDDKNNSRDDLEESILLHTAAHYSLAVKEKDIPMQNRMSVTPSMLDEMKDDELGPFAKSIHDTCLPRLEALGRYGVNGTTIKELIGYLVTYESKVSMPDVAIDTRGGITQTIPLLMADARQTLLMTDRLMLRFKRYNAELYLAYRAARHIGGRKSGNTIAMSDDDGFDT